MKRLGMGLLGGVLVAGVMTVSAPIAAADAIGPVFDIPAGIGMGQMTVATTADNFIDVRITGRTDALAPGPSPFGCYVYVGGGFQTTNLELDATGSGFARFGPFPDGDYSFGGKCASRDISATKSLISIPNPACGGCADNATLITLDGGAPVSQTAGTLAVAPPSESLGEYCDNMVNLISVVGLAALAAPGVGVVIGAATFAAGQAVRAMCIYYGDSVTKVSQICKAAMDLAIGGIERYTVPGIGLGVPSFCPEV